MRIVHEPDGADRTLAADGDRAETMLEQSRGLMFRRSIPDDYGLVFPFEDIGRRFIHMLFVGFPIDVVWIVGDEVQKVTTMHPWRSFKWAHADTVVELPAGAADDVETGDTVVVDR